MRDKIVAFLMEFMGIEVATAGIIEKNGKIFLTKRAGFLIDGGKWCLPGGHLRKWEKAEKGARREVNEETGFEVARSKLLFAHEEFVKRLNLHAIVFVYKMSVKGRVKKNFEVKESGWFNRKEIEKMNFAFTHKEILNKYFGRKKI